MLTIDGAHGEGGGQIIRSALALALATGTAFAIERIRAGHDGKSFETCMRGDNLLHDNHR